MHEILKSGLDEELCILVVGLTIAIDNSDHSVLLVIHWMETVAGESFILSYQIFLNLLLLFTHFPNSLLSPNKLLGKRQDKKYKSITYLARQCNCCPENKLAKLGDSITHETDPGLIYGSKCL